MPQSEDRETFGQLIDIDLTDADVAKKEHRNGEIDIAIDKINAERKVALAGFTVRLAPFKREKAALLKCIGTRRESMEVDCYLERDDSARTMLTRRVDTDEVVDSRALTDDECDDDEEAVS